MAEELAGKVASKKPCKPACKLGFVLFCETVKMRIFTASIARARLQEMACFFFCILIFVILGPLAVSCLPARTDALIPTRASHLIGIVFTSN